MANTLESAAGFVKAASDNLPTVDVAMVVDYYMNNPSYVSAECKNIRSLRAVRKEYGDKAVAFVQLKRENGHCLVKGQVSGEHKIKKYYAVSVLVNENEETIISCDCHTCPASESGACKHGAAFLMWINRRSEEPSVTSRIAYWKSSTLSRVCKEDEILTAEEIARKRKVPSSSEKSLAFKKKILLTTGLRSAIFDINSESRFKYTSIHQLIIAYKTRFIAGSRNPDSLLNFMKSQMSQEECQKIEKKTRKQSETDEWFEMRFGRITASKLHEASHCKTVSGSLTQVIMGASKFKPTAPIKRGLKLESQVLKRVGVLKNMKINPCGIFLSKDVPIFGASPDGITSEYVIEVKCPSKEKTVKNFIVDGVINPKFIAQVTLQMSLANKHKALFCVASPSFEIDKQVEIQEVTFDKKLYETLTKAATDFWKLAIYPILLEETTFTN